MHRPPARVLNGVGTLVRLGLAAVWLVSGGLKVVDPQQTRVAVGAYEVLPAGLVDPVATALPLVELAVGTVLLVGAFTRWAAVASALLLVVLMAGTVQAWVRGLSIGCGCFGGGGAVAAEDTRYLPELARETGFLALAGWLMVRPATALGADTWMHGDSRVRAGTPASEDGG